ncbi:uncharacterized protein JNUCC1_03501 [Lentibacillus sp. JNUCC-1]|uniref:hypothetical protein n=1 Tax=Lentibacillus sp. JNUCC-1 TaxID=2654513 RepID=UPI0012E6F525|nr:hypothetical protein [Lentibacillus sp. JNUCC-1]MUV39623.1 uncharacterized protein [Lentibacillus sp. JNUCC-1]
MDDKDKDQYSNETEKAPEYGKNKNHLTPEMAPPPGQAVQVDSLRQEEMAQELTADDISMDQDTGTTSELPESHANSIIGWGALALSVLSFFMMPIILGGGGVILGFVARARHANTLGTTAIVAGAASILITLFIAPFI